MWSKKKQLRKSSCMQKFIFASSLLKFQYCTVPFQKYDVFIQMHDCKSICFARKVKRYTSKILSKNEICMLNPASNKTLFCWDSFQTYVRLKLLANTGHRPLWSCFRDTSIPSKFLLNEDYFSGHWKFPASESCCIISCLGNIIIKNNSEHNSP